MSTEGCSTWHHEWPEPCSRCLNWLFWGLALPVGARCSYGGNYLAPSFNRKSQKDIRVKGKSPCLFVLAHGLRNADHYLDAAEAHVISLQTTSVWSAEGHVGWNRHNSTTPATVCVRSLEVTVERPEGHRVPAMAVSAQEKLDRWLEAAWKRVSETKIDQDNQDRNTWSSLISHNHMSYSSLLEAQLGLWIRPNY